MIPHTDLADPTRIRTPMADLADPTMDQVPPDQSVREAPVIHPAITQAVMSPGAGRDPEPPRQNSATLATGE